MSALEELLSVALLGTERRPLTAPRADGALRALLHKAASRPARNAEEQLLDAAAALFLHSRAGIMLPVSELENPNIARPDEDEDLAPLTGNQLSMLLEGYGNTLLPLWLDRANNSGKRLPPMLIPTMLNFGVNNNQLRTQITEVIGSRGRWLAGFNSDWHYAATIVITGASFEQLKRLFETGSAQERLDAISQLRESNPDDALNLVIANWDADSHQDRAAFLSKFATNLSMHDEPFLEEKARLDKRKEVRQIALELLSRLPESHLSQRMLSRLKPLLKLTGEQEPTLDITWPQEADQSLINDGIGTTQQATVQQKQEWLYQMISRVPPSAWERHFGIKPTEIINTIQPGELHSLMLMRSFESATIRHADQQWARALISSGHATDYAACLNMFARFEREELILHVIDSKGGSIDLKNGYNYVVLQMLSNCQHEWSESFAKKILELLRKHLPSADGAFNWQAGALIKTIAVYLPMSALAAAQEAFPIKDENWKQFKNDIGQFANTAHLKLSLFSALDKGAMK
jgi:hypothetical protein